MLYKTKYLLASTALAAGLLQATPSCSETVVHETVTESPAGTTTVTTEEHRTVMTGPHSINFMDFDLNKDGIVSVNEVARVLFKLYDTDGNEVIDNNEYERRINISLMPVQKDTVVSYDFDGDGRPDMTKYTYETFLQDTWLTRFDKNRDGLSAHEFTGRDFLEADVNHDHAIDFKEWQGTYIASIDKTNKEKARVNK